MAAVVQKELMSKIRSRNENQVLTFENGSHIGKPPVPIKKKPVGGQLSNPGWSTPPPKPPPYREHLGKKKSDGDTSSEPLAQKELSSSPPDRNPLHPNSSHMYTTVLAHKQTVPTSEGIDTPASQSNSSRDYEQNGTMKRTANKPHPHVPIGPRLSPPESDSKLERPPLPPPVERLPPPPVERLPPPPAEQLPPPPVERHPPPHVERLPAPPVERPPLLPPVERLPPPHVERLPAPPVERPPLLPHVERLPPPPVERLPPPPVERLPPPPVERLPPPPVERLPPPPVERLPPPPVERLPPPPVERLPPPPVERPTLPPPVERLPQPPPAEKPPLPPAGASEKLPSPDKGRIPRESLRNVAGIKSLISQFDSQKNPPEATTVAPSPVPPKPPRRTTSTPTERDKIPQIVRAANGKSEAKPPMGRKCSAPAQLEKIPQILSSLQHQDQLEPLSESTEEAVTPPNNSGTRRPPWGVAAHGNKVPLSGVHHQKQLAGQGSQDSGFCSDAEGTGSSHTTLPTHTEEGVGLSTSDSTPNTRFGFETREEKLRRSARRRGLFSDGHLMAQDSTMKRVPLNDRSSSYEDVMPGSSSHDDDLRTHTMESQISETSDGYLKVLPGQAIPPAPSVQRGVAQTADEPQKTLSQFPNELGVFMKALQGKEKKVMGEKRKHRKVIRNMSDPMLKALKVALDEEANRREPSSSNVDRSVNVKRAGNNGKKTDRTDFHEGSPTSPPSTSKGKSLVAKVTRLVRGKKDELAPKKSTGTSPLHSKASRSVIGKSFANEIAEQIQISPPLDISDPHRKVWRNRMDLCVPPPVPPPRYKDEIYEYVKMPFRRNVRVSVKYAGLQAVKTVPAISIPAADPTQPDDSETSPPPIYPKSRSIKRSILLTQGRDVTQIKDWNKSLSDLLSDSYPPNQSRQRARSTSEEVLFSSTLPRMAEGVLPHAEEPTLQRSTSYPDSISDELQNGGYDPYHLLLSKPSLKQRLLSTSVEVLCRIHEDKPALSESVKSNSSALGRSLTLPTSMKSKHRYENFDDAFSVLNRGAEGHPVGSRSRDGPSDDYIKMQRGDYSGMNKKKDFPRRKSDGGFFPGTQKEQKTKQRYMNIWEAADAIKEDPEEDGIPDYIRMHTPSINQGELAPSSPDRQLSAEDYIWCQQTRNSTIANEEHLVGREGEEEQEVVAEAKDSKNSYMNWMDIIDDFFPKAKEADTLPPKKGGTEKKDQHNSSSSSQASRRSIVMDDRNEGPHRPLPPVPFSIYSTLLPAGGGIECPVDEADQCYDERDEYIASKRSSVIIKNTEDEGATSKGDRYMNIADAELSLSADSPGAKQRPSIVDKVPMPSPRKASLSRRRPLNVLHPGIPFSELPAELKETNLQCQRQSIASIYSAGPGEPPINPGNQLPGSLPNGLCVICSAHEEFTHMGGVLKPREECGIYIEVPKDAIKKNSTQKLWFIACYDTQYPGESSLKAGTLSRNTSDEIQLLEQDRDMKATTVSPLVYVGPSTADLVKPLRIHLPHCISFPESSVKCWLEAKCYEMPRWAVVCQRPFFYTPPKSKEFNDPSYKPNILFQMAPASATIRTCHMGWFRVGASAFRGASKAAKHMFAGVFQRLPNDFNSTLNTISEEGDEDGVFTEVRKKDSNPKNELLIVISNSLPYVGEVIQWLLEKGTNKYVCLERYMPIKYCANGRDLEVILYGESSRAPIQTTSVPFGNLWRMKNIGEGWQTLTVRSPEKYQEQTLTFQLKQGDFPKQYAKNMRMHDVNEPKI